MTVLVDSFNRHINYMRISVTDRCNLRCIYCTAESFPILPRNSILSYEEIQRVVQAAAGLGVKTIRLTGGEPLMRPDLTRLVELLSQVGSIEEVSLTTNGLRLEKYAAELKAAGLKRVNISLDTFRADRFKQITGGNGLDKVFRGIEAARRAELNPVKMNMVVLRGINDDELLDFARMSISDGWHVRFIEYMPFLNSRAEGSRLIPVAEIMAIIRESLGELKPVLPTSGNGPAKYYQLPGARGTIGFIGALSDCFCTECNRFRLTADGRLRPCLLSNDEVDIKGPLRKGANTEELERLMMEASALKGERHHLTQGSAIEGRPMRQIGG